jgi:adenylyltransferase/sulfurtransferase
MDDRYARQTILPDIGITGQKRLSQSHALVIGAGGLGCPALLYLAAAGVGKITLIDDDTVSLSNLHRQVLFTTADIGKTKVDVAAQRLTALNPEVQIIPRYESFNTSNALSLLSDVDVLIDGSDNFPTKFLAGDSAVKTKVPLVYGAVLGFSGEVAVFSHKHNSPCLRCLYPEPPQGFVPNCAEAGVLGALAGMIGSMQALQALTILLDLPVVQGNLILFSGPIALPRHLYIQKDPLCALCSVHQQPIMLSSMTTATDPIALDVAAALAVADAVFVDVRETWEWQAGHIPEAIHLPLSTIQQNPAHAATALPPARPIVLYCQAGIRSHTAGVLLSPHLQGLNHLRGGFNAWLQEQNRRA